MDETSLAYNYGRGKGFMVSKRALPSGKTHRKEALSSSDAKARISFLGFVTHDPAVQPQLPQILIGNERRFTKKLLKELAAHTPPGYYLWREKSSWNTHALMRKAICILAKHLKDYVATHQLILVLDVAGCHLHHTICSLAKQKGILLLYIPGKLTWLLQPADTHVFCRLKRRLRQLWLDLAVRSAPGEVSHAEWLAEVFKLVKKLFNGIPWRSAFESNGLLDNSTIGTRILTELGWAQPNMLPSSIPSAEQLKVILPQRSKMAHATMFSWAMPKAKAKAKPKAKAGFPAAKPLPSGPISSGTRAKKKSLVID